MQKQISNKLGINMMDEMDGIGEDEVYDYSERDGDDDDDSDFSDRLDQASLGLLQAELDGANSEYTQGEGASKDDTDPSVIGGEFDDFGLEEEMDDLPNDGDGGNEGVKGNDPNNFIDVGVKPAEDETRNRGGEETTATSDSGSAAAGDSIPPEIRIDSQSKPFQPSNETEKENTENSQTKVVSDQEYEIGMQQVKYRALQEKMTASHAQSERMLEEQSQELVAQKEAKSMLELQLLKLQEDYDKLYKEKEELYKINKVQQKAILELQSKSKKRWR